MSRDELEALIANAKPWRFSRGDAWVYDPHGTQYPETLPKEIFDLLEGGSSEYRKTWRVYCSERVAALALREAVNRYKESRQ